MIRKLANLFILLPVGILLVVLSVANRQPVSLALNPFRPEDAQLAVQAPFFVFLFAALMLGMILGSLATWFKQGRHRKQARVQSREAAKWQAEADTHKTRAEEIAGRGLPQIPAQRRFRAWRQFRAWPAYGRRTRPPDSAPRRRKSRKIRRQAHTPSNSAANCG